MAFDRVRNFPGNWTTWGYPEYGSLTTSLTGTNNDLTYTSKLANVGANSITVAYVNPGTASAALSVSVTGTAITVNLATNGSSAITSTAALVAAAVAGSTPAAALVTVANATGNDGTGVVTALTATPLAGGRSGGVGIGSGTWKRVPFRGKSVR